MDESVRLKLPLLVPGQGQKDITHNEALLALDMLVQPVVQSATLASPPADAADGGCWLVPDGAVGAWSGRKGCLAMRVAGGWRFAVPETGWAAWVLDDGALWRCGPGGWAPTWAFPGAAPAVAPPAGGAVVDAEARAAIAAITGRLVALGLVLAG